MITAALLYSLLARHCNALIPQAGGVSHPTNSDHQLVLLGASPAKVCRHSGVRFQYVSGHGADDCLGSVMLGCIAVYKTWCFFSECLGCMRRLGSETKHIVSADCMAAFVM